MPAPQKTRHAIGVYKTRNGRYSAYGFKNEKLSHYLGTYATSNEAEEVREKSLNTIECADYLARTARPSMIDKGTTIEYCINKKGNFFYVRYGRNIGHNGYIGKYKTLASARLARDNAIRASGKKIKPTRGSNISSLPPDILALVRKPKFGKEKVVKPPKPIKIAKVKIINPPNPPKPIKIIAPKIIKPPTWQPEPEVILVKNADKIERKDGIFFIDNSWLVFITKDGKQAKFIAENSDHALKIQRDGCIFKIKGDL